VTHPYPPGPLEQRERVTGKRSRLPVDLILEQGSVSTEALEKEHGYALPESGARRTRARRSLGDLQCQEH
jgi:hypothetical protein